MAWDPDQYLRFSDERSLPFLHLVVSVGQLDPSIVVDLGCGTGHLTATLLERLPEEEHEEFLDVYRSHLRDAYPSRNRRTVFPFKRTFVVAVK